MKEHKCSKHGVLDWNFDRIRTLPSGHKRLECKKCGLENSRKWREKNHDYHLAEVKKWKAENRDKRLEAQREARRKNPDKYREYERKKREEGGQRYKDYYIAQRFEISIERYYEMLKEQDNKCYLCGNAETRLGRNGKVTRLAVDHNHTTNKVRKLLCHACNVGIGSLKENKELLKKAIDYLTEHEE